MFEEANIRLVLIGLEELGMDLFIDGKYWEGDMYLDEGKKTYKALKLKAYGLFEGYGLLDSRFQGVLKKAQDAGFEGNLKGDGTQLGATFVIVDGQVVLDHRQEYYGHEPEVKALFLAAGGKEENFKDPSELPEKEDCNDEVCALPPK